MRFDAVGSISGLLGTLLLALKFDPYLVFVSYMISNMAWITWVIKTKGSGWLLLMNLGYTVIGILGLYNWS